MSVIESPYSRFPPSGRAPEPGINIYGAPWPDPYKLIIAAQELGIKYKYHSVDTTCWEHRRPWYKEINPDGKLPAIIHCKPDGTTVTVFESNACLLYLAAHFDHWHRISPAYKTPDYWTQLSWLTWQVACYGPMMDQALLFNRQTLEKIKWGRWRYTTDCQRLNSVLNRHLSRPTETQPYHSFITGDSLTLPDIAIFVRAYTAKWCGLDIDKFPHVKRWRDELLRRPAFQKALRKSDEGHSQFAFGDYEVLDPKWKRFCRYSQEKAAKIFGAATSHRRGRPAHVPSDHANSRTSSPSLAMRSQPQPAPEEPKRSPSPDPHPPNTTREDPAPKDSAPKDSAPKDPEPNEYERERESHFVHALWYLDQGLE